MIRIRTFGDEGHCYRGRVKLHLSTSSPMMNYQLMPEADEVFKGYENEVMEKLMKPLNSDYIFIADKNTEEGLIFFSEINLDLMEVIPPT